MAAIAVLAVTALAALVAVGMATGTDQQFDKGVTPLAMVLAVQIVGTVCLVLFVAVLRFWVGVRGGERPWHLSRWSVGVALCWLLWAFLRLVEYPS